MAVGQALADHEAAVLVAVVGQVFLVARKHVEDGCQGVERQGCVAVEHGEQRGLPLVGEKVAVLLLNRGFKKQFRRFQKQKWGFLGCLGNVKNGLRRIA